MQVYPRSVENYTYCKLSRSLVLSFYDASCHCHLGLAYSRWPYNPIKKTFPQPNCKDIKGENIRTTNLLLPQCGAWQYHSRDHPTADEWQAQGSLWSPLHKTKGTSNQKKVSAAPWQRVQQIHRWEKMALQHAYTHCPRKPIFEILSGQEQQCLQRRPVKSVRSIRVPQTVHPLKNDCSDMSQTFTKTKTQVPRAPSQLFRAGVS